MVSSSEEVVAAAGHHCNRSQGRVGTVTFKMTDVKGRAPGVSWVGVCFTE